MTDFLNLDASYFEKSFSTHDGMSRDNIDASQVLAAALEQMDDIIAATNEPNKEEQHAISCIPAIVHVDKPCTESTIPLCVQDSQFGSDSKVTVNIILDDLKNYILSRSDANDNFVPNKDFNIPAAKVVLSWLLKQFKNHSVDIEENLSKV